MQPLNTQGDTPRSTSQRLLIGVLICMMFGLFATLAGLLAPEPVAHANQPFSEKTVFAGMVSQSGGLTCMTTDAGNEDVLLVLDSRNEELFVYRTDIKQGIQLVQRYPLPQMFLDARARSQGRP